MTGAKTIYLYVTKHFIISFTAVMSLFGGLILLFDSIELLRRSATIDVNIITIAKLTLFKFPQMIHTILPFAIMATTTIVLWRLSRSNELIAIRSVGISAWHFLMPIIFMSFIIGIINITIANPIASSLYKRYEILQGLVGLKGSSPLHISPQGIWLRDRIRDKVIIANSKNINQTQDNTMLMKDVSFVITNPQNKFLNRMEAKKAVLKENNFYLYDINVYQPDNNQQHLKTTKISTNLSTEKINENFASPESVSFWDLKEFISFFKKSGFNAHKHILYYNSLLASPLLLCATAILAAAFSLSPNQRQIKIVTRVVIGISTGFLFFFITRITYALGISNILPIILSVWIPVAVFIMIGMSIILHIEDG